MYNPAFAKEKIGDFIQNTLGIQVSHEVRVFMAGAKFIGALNTIEQKTLFYGKVNVSYSEQIKSLWVFKLRGQYVYVIDTTAPEYAQFQKEILFDEVYLANSITEVVSNYTISGITYNGGVANFNLRLIGGGRTLLYGYYDDIGVLLDSANLLDGAPPGVLDVRAFHRYFNRPSGTGFEAGYTFIKQGNGIFVTEGQLIDLSQYIGAGGTFTLQYLTGQMSLIVNVVGVGCSVITKHIIHAGLNVVLPVGNSFRYAGLTNYKFLMNQTSGSVVVRMKNAGGTVMQTLSAVPVVGGYIEFVLADTGMASSTVMELIYTAVSSDFTNKDWRNATGGSLTITVDGVATFFPNDTFLITPIKNDGTTQVLFNGTSYGQTQLDKRGAGGAILTSSYHNDGVPFAIGLPAAEIILYELVEPFDPAGQSPRNFLNDTGDVLGISVGAMYATVANGAIITRNIRNDGNTEIIFSGNVGQVFIMEKMNSLGGVISTSYHNSDVPYSIGSPQNIASYRIRT
jgi:hypothetical protein